MKLCGQCDDYRDYEEDDKLKHKCLMTGKEVEPWYCTCSEKRVKEETISCPA